MANISISKQDKAVIKAAVKLGDWLLSLPEVQDKDAETIKAIQQALEKLPKINDGTLSMFGLSIERGDEEQGLVRGWDVSLEYFANDPERQGGLELFSSYIVIPETNDATVLEEKANSEVYFHWPVAGGSPLMTEQQVKQWCDDVAEPLRYWQAGDRLRLEIVHQDHYAEIECVIDAVESK